MLDIAEIEIARLPMLPLVERASLPDCAAIYFVVAKGGEILYIGKADCLAIRWRAHHRMKQIPETASIAWLAVVDSETLSGIESDLIRRFRPSLNWLPFAGPTEKSVSLGVRVPQWVADFYRRQAELERRKTSAVARLVLVDYAEKGRAA